MLPQWPHYKEDVTPLFLLEESFFLSHEVLTVLCGFLKHETDVTVLRALSYILLKYVRSDAVLTAVLDCSCVEMQDKIENYKHRMDWENFVQLLTSLPERVANRLQTETPKEFSHEDYCYKLIFHVIRGVDYMSESCFHQEVMYDISYLAHFLSKVIINYNMTDVILKFVDILIGWSANDQSLSKFVRRRLTQTLFNHLNRQAIDSIALILLKRCPIDYRTDEQAIFHLLGDNIDSSKDWNDILTYRIPFYYKPTDYKDTTVVENLIYYLSTTKNNPADTLAGFVLKLASVWSDVKLCNVSNIPQHMHISHLMLLAVKYRSMISNRDNVEWDLVETKSILFKGVSRHLRVLLNEFRCIGMTTVETIFKILSTHDDSEREAAANLNFDLSCMGDTCVDIQRILRGIIYKCLIDPERRIPRLHKVKPINLQGLLDLVATRVIDGDNWPAENTLLTVCTTKTKAEMERICKTCIYYKLDDYALSKSTISEIEKSEQLDSDDDLQPYDMSNDVAVATRKRANYLRDLLEVLVDPPDAETFEASLDVAEELVLKQLKTEDRKLVEDLLNLFVHIEEKFHVENFDSIKFNTVVAIVYIQPKVAAAHLCKEIHTDVGRYSIATKIFMLDALAEAASRIAGVNAASQPAGQAIDDDEDEPEVITRENDLPAAEIIRRRLVNKTRYFHTIRPHPFSRAKRNQFAAVSDFFFYPLVSGFGCKQLSLSYHNLKHDVDSVLLLKYLSVVGNIILASKNCPKCSSYCWEILQIITYMRHTPDPKIQMAVISLLASVVLVLPPLIMKTEFLNIMLEFRSWLGDCLTNIDLTMRFGGSKSESAIFAGQVLYMMEKAMSEE
ncbi:telomere length regulation protein TEL2 homolog [Ostrinia nubilalis]|uniref:telomere length regulation protein TEL2 homolog n=1 Tax=Ostrinia nubilalis TaxID=29057 RepID=UPI0030824AA0